MTYLLDTHVLLWALFSPEKLSPEIQNILENPEVEVLVSALSFWEISLKFQLGKLDLNGVKPEELPQIVQESGFNLLPLEASEAASSSNLTRNNHKDPFDRMLVWQCIQRDFTLISKDRSMQEYEVLGLNLLW
jgi:PIN domain nuclease of toxin-antitoxin system